MHVEALTMLGRWLKEVNGEHGRFAPALELVVLHTPILVLVLHAAILVLILHAAILVLILHAAILVLILHSPTRILDALELTWHLGRLGAKLLEHLERASRFLEHPVLSPVGLLYDMLEAEIRFLPEVSLARP
jgi:hypothetical protein